MPILDLSGTAAGARLTEHQFKPWRGHLGKLEHIGAVGDLRIHLSVQAPAASWVSERELLANQAAALFGRDGKKRSDAPHIPDAELILPSGECRNRRDDKARGSGQSPATRLMAGNDPRATRPRSGVTGVMLSHWSTPSNDGSSLMSSSWEARRSVRCATRSACRLLTTPNPHRMRSAPASRPLSNWNTMH